ncbi:DUF3667 domain-containing protein [Aurantiacibacter gangjinensis]|uniref:Uncharacterized protein n=1 Tax=Aurantiacibacter gangjinensis TaxID=502682 RepID=A0A0G9MKC7_9SPHN|nr:DUF3667 domain-containing protein [Aurantiacibacter gangjinensis]APE29448.1 hypothetical protein BMF35_b0193 [Aurantiacibacter gangjinensis]KLE31171.1 hypothetical protein AAW01_13180 [Aurantiacibacter gangjinensis]
MSDWFGGLGSAAEGGLFARAIEPDSGAKDAHPDQPDNCRNCGAQLTGAYCSACGQQGLIHRTISAFVHELLHGALHFEGKLWRTLPMLVFRPGKLTRRYIDGERARFVSPMALFLFGVFLMFAVFQVLGLTAPTGLQSPDTQAAVERIEARAEAERDTAQERLDAIEENASTEEREAAETRLAEAQTVLDGLEQIEALDLAANSRTNFVGTIGIPALDEVLIEKWQQDPDLMIYKLQANAYKFSWMLIPISIPFMYLLFLWRRRFAGYDHAIFVTYSLSFVTLLFITLSLLAKAGIEAGALVVAAMLIVPVHMYKQLRYSYELRRFSAFWRLMALSLFIWIIITLFLWLLLALGAF